MEIYIDLQISSKTHNVNLDGLLNLKGKMHRIGDKSKTGIILDYSQWNYSFNTIQIHDINEVATAFFDEIDKVKDKLKSYIKETASDVVVYFVIKNYDNEYIHLDLSKDNITKFSEIEASISVDGI
ncbi:MAG: DUF4279 domain-containing protein [Treponema sp.]|nr:DUF4279 domain-containing protein [Treponema sp.]